MDNTEKGLYHPDCGYWQVSSKPSASSKASWPEGTVEVELCPGEGYTYNGTSWVAPSSEWLYEKESVEVRLARDRQLKILDRILSNPLRWAAMTTEEQNTWSTYRTDLLNVPQQSGFPGSVVWPVKPEIV